MAKKVARKRVSAPKKAASAKTAIGAQPSPNGQISQEEEVRLQAYLKWEAAGKPLGDGSQFWMEAEKELLAKK
jgi:hypothetical protein